MVLPIGMGAALFLNGLIKFLGLLELFPNYTSYYSVPLFSYSYPVGMLMNAVIMPGIEELMFRYIFFDRLSRMIPIRSAAVVSSVVFGIYHRNTIQLIYAFLMGLLFCYIYYRFRSILASWLCHGAANAIVYTLGSFEIFGILNKAPWNYLLSIAGLMALLFFMYKLVRSDKEPERTIII